MKLHFNVQTEADGVVAMPKREPTGYYDEVRIEVVFIDGRSKREISHVFYISNKDKLNSIRTIIEEVEP
jgi:hypothetical protein